MRNSVLAVSNFVGGNDDVGNGHGLAVLIHHGDLRFGVRAQPRDFAALADVRQFAAEAVGEHDRRGHQFGRFIAGVTKHQALVAGTLFVGLLTLGFAGVHALGDVGGLLGDNYIYKHAVGMKDVIVIDIADLADGRARDLDEIQVRLRGDLTADDDDVGFDVGFAGDAGKLVLREAGVQHGVRNGVRHFVRMALADGFG